MRVTIELDETSLDLLKRSTTALETIAKFFKPSPYAVTFQIFAVQENSDMKPGKLVALTLSKGKKAGAGAPIQLSDSAPQPVAVFGIDAAGAYGALLAPGATIVMSMSAGANGGTPGTFVQDPTPGSFSFTDPTGQARTGVPSVASGVFTPSTGAAVDVNDPFSISYAITGGSGDTGSAQFETAVGVEVSEVIGLPTATPAATKVALGAKATGPWSVSFTGLASDAKAWLASEYDAEKAKYGPDVQNALTQAKAILASFVSSVKSDVQVAIAAAQSDLSADGFNLSTSATNHPSK